MGFGKKSSTPKSNEPTPTITAAETRPTDTLQRAAVAERSEQAASPQLLSGGAADDEEARRRASTGLLG